MFLSSYIFTEEDLKMSLMFEEIDTLILLYIDYNGGQAMIAKGWL